LAVEKALGSARENPWEKSVASEELGVLVAAGKLEEAHQRYEQSYQLREKLAKDNPSSADAREM